MKRELLFSRRGQFYERLRASLPETTKAKLASPAHADHQRREMASKDPEVQPAAELVLWYRRLHEQFPGTPMLVMSWKQAQSGCWLQPHQLLDGS
jgi:hypothetical protein